MLDIDHGTYPFVTSSSCCAGGAPIGTGVGPKAIDRVLGIAKAYITRVGSGPFPTELTDEVGERLCEVGGEYGVTTGRKRRCGWYDAVVGRYAAQVNSLTDVALTKLDVLSCVPRIKVCVAYEIEGKRYDYFPMDQELICSPSLKPIYEELHGWEGTIFPIASASKTCHRMRRSTFSILKTSPVFPLRSSRSVPIVIQTIFNGWEAR